MLRHLICFASHPDFLLFFIQMSSSCSLCRVVHMCVRQRSCANPFPSSVIIKWWLCDTEGRFLHYGGRHWFLNEFHVLPFWKGNNIGLELTDKSNSNQDRLKVVSALPYGLSWILMSTAGQMLFKSHPWCWWTRHNQFNYHVLVRILHVTSLQRDVVEIPLNDKTHCYRVITLICTHEGELNYRSVCEAVV